MIPSLINASPSGTQACSPINRLVSLIVSALDAYLIEIRRVWPQNLYYYREEIALMYLAFKSYQVDKALTSIYFNNEELIQLI
jgi:hypothetical protein